MADHDWRRKRDWKVAKHYEKVTVQEMPEKQRKSLWKMKNDALAETMLSDLKKRLEKGEKHTFTKIHGVGFVVEFRSVEYKLEYNKRYKSISITKTPLMTLRGSTWATAKPEKVQSYGLGKQHLKKYRQPQPA